MLPFLRTLLNADICRIFKYITSLAITINDKYHSWIKIKSQVLLYTKIKRQYSLFMISLHLNHQVVISGKLG